MPARDYLCRRIAGVAPTLTTFPAPATILTGMKLLTFLLVGVLSVRATRNVLLHNRRRRRLQYLPR